MCWAWSEARALTDAFTEAVGSCRCLFGCTPVSTYQGFMGALVTWTPRLMPLLRGVLQRRMAQLGSRFWRVGGWVPIAFDGSRGTAPRTRSNEDALCAKNYGKGHTARYRKKKSRGMRRKNNQKHKPHPQEPQAWITLLWHMGWRLPWSWRLGPSNASERAHVMDMVQTEAFPRKTLFCGDAGFVGYPLWACLVQAGGHFLVRVGANASLLTEQARCVLPEKGKERLVLCWPKAVARADQPPLRLRLLRVRVGKAWMWMLTSVLSRRDLSVKAITRLYPMRWGVEVEFRGLKQTLDRAKLRSRNARRLLAELDWSILAMAVAELFATKEQQARKSSRGKRGGAGEPSRRSLAGTMRALRGCLRHLTEVPEAEKDLASRLRAAVTDGYDRQRPKRARYRPPNPDKKPLGDPNLRPLETAERRKLRKMEAEKAA
jgi:hypothetical protein